MLYSSSALVPVPGALVQVLGALVPAPGALVPVPGDLIPVPGVTSVLLLEEAVFLFVYHCCHI